MAGKSPSGVHARLSSSLRAGWHLAVFVARPGASSGKTGDQMYYQATAIPPEPTEQDKARYRVVRFGIGKARAEIVIGRFLKPAPSCQITIRLTKEKACF